MTLSTRPGVAADSHKGPKVLNMMRNCSALFLALLLVASATGAQEVEPTWLEVADVALRLRSGPSTDDDIITQLTPREIVELLQRGEGWSKIRRQDGTSGWAHNNYLLPWDERNRPDARRRVGERRLFRVYGQHRNADLRIVSDHSYIYTVPRRAGGPVPNDEALLGLGNVFDEIIYPRSLDLWGIEDPPHINGDERILVLLASGFDDIGFPGGTYYSRDGLPQEPGTGIGYVSLALAETHVESMDSQALIFYSQILAHEFGHLLHDLVGVHNHVRWVQEGLAQFTERILGPELRRAISPATGEGTTSTFPAPDSQLNLDSDPSYHTSELFMVYIHERLGIETLRDFAAHSRRGMDALDALLAERGEGMDADDFFADWVLANHLNDTRRENGRFGYTIFADSLLAIVNPIRQLPATLRDLVPPYHAAYHELPLSRDPATADQLLLDFRLNAPPPQDAWLQLVQVLPSRIDVQRFRASDFRHQPVLASLLKGPERSFVAISPFTPGARQRTSPVSYSLALRHQTAPADARAQATTSLHVRSAPQRDAMTLGKLRPCSFVQVLQRGPQWSQVRNAEGLSGWSHNAYLFHLNAPSPGVRASSCAALVRAAHDGNLATVQRLLADGADVNGRDAFGRSALHEAAFRGHERIIASLLRAGADPHARDAAGRTPLDEVSSSGDINSIRLLHEAAGLDPGSPAHQALVVEAAVAGLNDLLQILPGSDRDINWRDDSGRTALAAAAASGRDRAVKALITAGADVSLADENGRTPFMWAASGGNPVAMERIYRVGVEVNHVDHEGHNALTLAAANGRAASVAWLLLSTDVNVHHALPDSGRNALHLAAAAGHADVIAMLLLGKAPADAPDADGFLPLQLARNAGHSGAAAMLNMVKAEQGRRSTSTDYAHFENFLAAARSGNLREVERLMKAGAPYWGTDSNGFSGLMYAVRAGHQDVVLRLLLAGVDPDFRGPGQSVDPAIFFSIGSGHDDISAMLLLAGGRGNVGYNSALDRAASSNRADILRLLLDSLEGNFPVDHINAWNETPLHHAVVNQHPRIVGILLDSGADPNALRGLNFSDRSPLAIARNSGNSEIIDLLLAAGAEA